MCGDPVPPASVWSATILADATSQRRSRSLPADPRRRHLAGKPFPRHPPRVRAGTPASMVGARVLQGARFGLPRYRKGQAASRSKSARSSCLGRLCAVRARFLLQPPPPEPVPVAWLSASRETRAVRIRTSKPAGQPPTLTIASNFRSSSTAGLPGGDSLEGRTIADDRVRHSR